MKQKQSIKLQIQRHRIKSQIYIFQPLLLVGLYGYNMYLIFTGYFLVGGTLLLSLSVVLGIYLRFNFIKKYSTIFIEMNETHLSIEEHQFWKIKYDLKIEDIHYIYLKDKKIANRQTIKKLICFYRNKERTLLNMYNLLFGVISNTDIQELLFYIQKFHPTIEIHATANAID